MTLQNLSKILDKYESQLGSTNAQQFELSYFVDYRSIIGELVLMKITPKKLALDEPTLLKMTLKQ